MKAFLYDHINPHIQEIDVTNPELIPQLKDGTVILDGMLHTDKDYLIRWAIRTETMNIHSALQSIEDAQKRINAANTRISMLTRQR